MAGGTVVPPSVMRFMSDVQTCVLLVSAQRSSKLLLTVRLAEDEPKLEFRCLYAIDGNSSLKRAAMFPNRTAGDTRVLDDSTYFLSEKYVDRFKDEVRGKRTKNPP